MDQVARVRLVRGDSREFKSSDASVRHRQIAEANLSSSLSSSDENQLNVLRRLLLLANHIRRGRQDSPADSYRLSIHKPSI